MASKRFEKGSKEWNMFSEYWALCQRYWLPEDNDEYWSEMVGALGEFCGKYKDINREFVSGLCYTLETTRKPKAKDGSAINVACVHDT